MTFSVNVKGGTGAGRRMARPRPSWTCKCPRVFDELWHKPGHSLGKSRSHPPERYSCPDCGERRPS